MIAVNKTKHSCGRITREYVSRVASRDFCFVVFGLAVYCPVMAVCSLSNCDPGYERSHYCQGFLGAKQLARRFHDVFSAVGTWYREASTKYINPFVTPPPHPYGWCLYVALASCSTQEAISAKKSLESTHLYGRHLVGEWAEDVEDVDTLRAKAARDLRGPADGGRAVKRQKGAGSEGGDDFADMDG